MTTLVNIRCRPLSLSISREACGAQVTRPHAPAACRGCEVGAAHARGEVPTCWADGEPVEEVVPVVPVSAPQRSAWKPPAAPRYAPQPHKPRPRKTEAPKPKPKRVRASSRSAKRYPWGDAMLTARELAALPEARATSEHIRNRIDSYGWSVEDAVQLVPSHGMGRDGIYIDWRGQRLTVRALAAVPEAARGLTARMLRNRIARWGDVERAVTTPVSVAHVERMRGASERRDRRRAEAAS